MFLMGGIRLRAGRLGYEGRILLWKIRDRICTGCSAGALRLLRALDRFPARLNRRVYSIF